MRKLIFAAGTSLLLILPILFITPGIIYDNPTFFLSPAYIIIFSISTFFIYKFLDKKSKGERPPKPGVNLFAIPLILSLIAICFLVYGLITSGGSGEGLLAYYLGFGILIIFAFFFLIYFILIKRATGDK